MRKLAKSEVLAKSGVNALEKRRQFFHLALGLLIVGLLYARLINEVMLLAIIIAAIITSLYCRNHELPIISWFLKRYEREDKIKKFPGGGLIFLLSGVLLVFSLKFFTFDIVLASTMILALGDSVSHLVGRFYGRTRNPFNTRSAKLLEGTVAGIVVSTIGAALFVKLWEAILASTVAMLFESYELKFNENTLDDNLIVPFVAALTIYLVRLVF